MLPPPHKILRRGTPELEEALKKGEVHLSLPHTEWALWMDRSVEIKSVTTTPTTNTSNEEIEKTKASSSPQKEGETTPKTRKNITLTRFRDIIGHAAVKLRMEEILLPLALPQQLADSIGLHHMRGVPGV